MGDLWGQSLFTMSHSSPPPPSPSLLSSLLSSSFSRHYSWSSSSKHPFADNSPWKRERNILNPAFKLSSLRALHPIFSSEASNFVRKFLSKASSSSSSSSSSAIDFHQEISRYTLEMISLAGFGYQLGDKETPTSGEETPHQREAREFLNSLEELFHAGVNVLVILPFGNRILRYLLRKHYALVDKIFFRIIDQRIEQTRAKSNQEASSPSPSPPPSSRKTDLLDLMLQPNEEGELLSKTAIRNELFIFFVAGSETSGNTMSWTIYLLSRHPEILGRVRDEIDEIMGPRAKREGGWEIDAPSLEQVESMTYLSMVINEALRLYPAVPSITRYASETFEFKGYIYPKGAFINASPLLVHRDERFWPNPERFDPERFSKENSEGRHPFAFFPFGGGPRICIGRNFFFLEAKTLLATFIRHVDFSLDPTLESGKMRTPSATLRPNAVWIHPSLRN